MKITKKIEKEILAVMDDYWGSYLNGDLPTWASYLPDDYRNIGTTKAEIWNSKKEIVEFTEMVLDQTAGMAETRNKKTQVIPYDPYVMVHELGDLYVKTEEGWVFYAPFRLSSLLEKTTDGWKILHQHGSYPDSKTEEGEAFGFDELKIENKKLRDAIQARTIELERKNRELEIESALERVRAVAMSMKTPKELQAVGEVIFKELKSLGFSDLRNTEIIINQDEKQSILSYYYSDYGVSGQIEVDYTSHPVLKKWAEDMQKAGDGFAGVHISENEMEGWKKYREELGYLPDPKLDKAKTLDYYSYSTGMGALSISSFTPVSAEQLATLERFRNVFGLAYRRYLEVVQAEARAREAEIEAALERVRAKTMAMHNSEDVGQCILKLFGELTTLGVPESTRLGIGIFNHDNENMELWTASKDEEEQVNLYSGNLDMSAHPLLQSARNSWKEKQRVNQFILEGKKEVLAYFQVINASPAYQPKIKIERVPDKVIHYDFVFDQGIIYAFCRRPLPEELIGVFRRFSALFEQTYRRYLDLVKAEAQAREAEIEAALERVRSRSMAMHQSEEIQKVANTLFKNLLDLGVSMDTATILVPVKGSKDFEIWIQNIDSNYSTKVLMPYQDHPITKDFLNAAQNQLGIFTANYSKEKKDSFFQFFFSHPDALANIPEERKRYVLDGKAYAISLSFNPHTGMQIGRYSNTAFSEADNNILQRFAKVFEQSYTRFLDLQKAEAQAREAQIEAALERVRSRSLAVNRSEEFNEVVGVVFEKLSDLGMPVGSVTIALTKEGTKDWEVYGCGEGESGLSLIKFNLPYFPNAFSDDILAAQSSAESGYFSKVYSEAEKNKYYEYVFKKTELKNLPDDLKERVWQSKSYALSIAFTKNSSIMVNEFEGKVLNVDQASILKRFSRVFEQSYIRFLDLQRAEAQAREAEIEAALERVRAQTMAMHSSEDVGKCIVKMFGELTALGVDEGTRFGIGILNHDNENNQLWTASKEGEEVNLHIGQLDMSLHPLLISARKAWKEQLPFHKYILEGEDLLNYYQMLNSADDYKYRKAIEKLPEREFHYGFVFDHGFFYAFNSSEFQAEIIQIIQRFTSLFGQTYRRYLDLVKAEEQARKAQIEAAVERVRAEAMAMHSSEDFSQVNEVLWEQVKKLEVTGFAGAGIALFDQDDHITWWDFSSAGNIGKHEHKVTRYNYKKYPLLGQEIWEAYQTGEPYFIIEYDLPRLKEGAKEWAAINPTIAAEFEKAIASGHLTYQWGACARITNGFLTFDHLQPPDEDAKNILLKMAGAFELAYQRFLDLQKAEIQAKEALKRAALDRVRGEIASMRSTEDLNRITPVIWRELTSLEVPFIRCGVFIVNEASEVIEVYLTTPEGKPLGVLNLPFDLNSQATNTVKYWREKKVYREHWDAQAFTEWTQSMIEMGQVKNFEDYQGTAKIPDELHLHFVPFNQGMLYVGDVNPLQEEKIELVKTLADAFAIAYARYEDFVSLEQAKTEVEIALAELKSTQSQLIHAEKMASLGQLTAGIAHEIQNPLNFVNNFSEVSNELLDEMSEVLENGDLEEVRTLAHDIKQNLNKINHHGQRADAIVKGMLQHSRKSSGKKTPTDINNLADEYLRLAYHGLRAKDKTFNASLHTDFDQTLKSITVIPQDIGRVLLNLITNAFYAVQEKKKNCGNGYHPRVTICTRQAIDHIAIAIEDNGNGIPQHVLDKIFQPFFTTKPTGQGTGLGLSLSYDIVKAHDGKLEVETEEGARTIFRIILPKKNQ